MLSSAAIMPWSTATELDELVERFRARTLPKSEWTHRTHLAVGTWHVHRHGAEEALGMLRSGITLLNEAHGTINSDTSGYHETITRAYVRLIADFLAARPDAPTADCVHALLASPLAARTALFLYYSEGRLMSVSARRGWLEPDLAPLRLPPT